MTTFRIYSKSEIEHFLKAVDQYLDKEFTLILIGGTAAALAYKATDYTKDIDTTNDTSAIDAACEAARKSTGLNIPLGKAGVEDGPYDYEDRLERYQIEGLKKLTIYVPEKHDLVLMKIMRANENDLNTIDEIKKNCGLEFETLVDRFSNNMKQVHGDPGILRQNFLAAIERMFSNAELSTAEKRVLKNWKV
jgi:hypothetical protein